MRRRSVALLSADDVLPFRFSKTKMANASLGFHTEKYIISTTYHQPTVSCQYEQECTWFILIIYVVIQGPIFASGFVGNALSFFILQADLDKDSHGHAAKYLLQVSTWRQREGETSRFSQYVNGKTCGLDSISIVMSCKLIVNIGLFIFIHKGSYNNGIRIG